MKKILIITSYITGHGHKSITNALEAELKTRENVDFKSVEGLEFAGKAGVQIGELYGPVTRGSAKLWKLIYTTAGKTKKLESTVIKNIIKKKFYEEVADYRPDIILSVHPIFTSAIADLIKERNLNIPFAILINDLVSISPLWIDPRADLIIAPTIQAKMYAEKNNVPSNKIVVLPIPIRKEILDTAKNINSIDEELIRSKEKIHFLIMSGGEGSGDLERIILSLYNIENAQISVVCGRNKNLQELLSNKFADHYDKILIYGFVTDIEELLISHDIGVVRGSPNTLMECINCTLPVIVTATLPGQEEGNVDFILDNHLGLYCPDTNNLANAVESLLANNMENLIKIKNNQFNFRDLHTTEKIVDELLHLSSTL
ncbi:MAG: glycosyltransferase [Oscillospiraceae bacterium]|nr:glycosyltransferase [Oscillospiraceae bacterium]